MQDRKRIADAARDGGFETPSTHPGGFYDTPEAVVADPEISTARKRRYLADWADVLDKRLREGGATAGPDGRSETEMLALVRRALADLD
jgi:arginase family enzyme